MSIINKVQTGRKKRVARELTVKSAKNLTKNMRRITFHGDGLSSFPPHSTGAYIKLIFDIHAQEKPAMRTYTVAEQRSDQNEIDVDFMLHGEQRAEGNHGIAAPWSVHAKPGDKISIFGPGPAKFINLDAEYFLLAADMTALPALAANLKLLPDNACGAAFIEVLSEADKQDLKKPPNVELIWIINSSPGSDESPLFHVVEQSHWHKAKHSVWVACEFKTMRKIRHYLKVERSIEKSHLYISSYWKKGNTEEQHKVTKQADQTE